jgi:hypothetical protein
VETTVKTWLAFCILSNAHVLTGEEQYSLSTSSGTIQAAVQSWMNEACGYSFKDSMNSSDLPIYEQQAMTVGRDGFCRSSY